MYILYLYFPQIDVNECNIFCNACAIKDCTLDSNVHSIRLLDFGMYNELIINHTGKHVVLLYFCKNV